MVSVMPPIPMQNRQVGGGGAKMWKVLEKTNETRSYFCNRRF
jgi:hypothetical protein